MNFHLRRLPRLSLCAVPFLLPALLKAAPIVTLEQAKGSKTMQVELLGLTDKIAHIRNAKGKEFKTPLHLFSKASQERAKKAWAEQNAGDDDLRVALNEAIGQSLFSESGQLFTEEAEEVAERLGLPVESKTPYTSSYRLYTDNDFPFAGAFPKTIVLYGDDEGKTNSFSIIYSNKGDSLSKVGSGEDHFDETGKPIDRGTLAGSMLYDETVIAKALTKVLGEPENQRMLGQGNKTNKVKRWDWNGHSLLLTVVEDEYVGLSIVSTEFADGGGRFSRISDGDMKKRLISNLAEKENGDVVIENIPMVDQGPKGYCAPATFERAMRHAGVAADMYLLATLATSPGGGTYTGKLYDEVAFTTRSKGGRTAREIELKSLSPGKIKRYINKGVPILWQMCSLRKYNDVANERTKERAEIQDWSAYASKIEREAEENVPDLEYSANYHICLIIGYNEKTNEIAVSDSWGSRYEIRWIHVDEAEAVSNETGFVIDL